MNEEALQQLYTLAQGEGYSKSFDDFKVLMSSNQDALNNMYTVAQGEGYQKSMDDFKVLVGFGGQVEISQEVKDEFAKDPVREAVKKKDVTESVSADGSLESQISDEQAQFMQNLSGSGFETMSTEDIKQSFTPVTGPTDFDVEENPDRYKVIKVEQATEENPFALGNDIIDLQVENLQVRQENLERYKRKLEQDIEAMVPEQNTPPPQPKIVGYDKFSNTPIYDYSEAFADFDKQAKLVSAEVDSQPIREEIDDLNLRILETKIPGFKKQPSFKEVYQAAYDPKTRKFDKEKLAEIDSDLPLLTNDFFEDLMASPGAARSIYNAHVENYYNDKKRAAGYINVGGELVDPSTPLPKGYGFDAAINSFGSFAGIVSKEEEEAVGRLNNMFNQYGFTFEQTAGGDRLLGFGPDGKQLKFFGEDELPLDNWTDATDKKYGSELKRVLVNAYEDADFTDEEMLKQALLKPSSMQADVVGAQPSLIAASGSWTKRAIGQIEKDNKVLNDLAVLMNSQNILGKNAMKKADALKDKEFKNGLWTSYEAQEEYNTLIKEVNDIAQVYEGTYNAALKMDTDLKNNVNQIKKYEGDRAMMMANMWDPNNVPALMAQSLGEGAAGVISGYYGLADDAFSNIINLASGYDETSVGYQTDEKRRERKASVSKQLKEGAGSLLTLDMLTDGKTSAETIAGIQSQPLLSRAGTLGVFMGVAQSVPAMLTGNPVMSFAAMHMDGMAREMDNIPEFKNISENEKMLVLAPIATVAGVLENFGFRNALGNSSLTARLTIGALKKFGAQTAKEGTKRTFREIVERSVMNKFAKGGILLASSAAAEAETGAAQEMAETYMKEIYDLVKGQDFYKQSIDLSKGEIMNMEFAKEIVKAGYAEAIGGLVLGAPAAYSAAVGNNTIPEISDAAFNLFTMTTTPESVERTLEVQRAVYQAKVGVETNPETGQKYTQKEVDDTLLQYEYLLGQKNEINPNWDASYQKQVLALLMQKKNLEQSIEGLNKDTTKDQQRQIEILKEDIEIISSEANKNYEEVLKKEYEQAKKEGFTGTIEAFKFRQSVEKAAEERGKQAPVKEEIVEEAAVVEEAPVEEEKPTVQQEVLETQPITKITNDLVTKEKKGELTQEETDGILLGIMEKIEAENAKRKSPLSPEQAQKKLGKMQQRVFEANKDRYLELSGVMPAAQEQAVEEAPVTEEKPREVIEEGVMPSIEESSEVQEVDLSLRDMVSNRVLNILKSSSTKKLLDNIKNIDGKKFRGYTLRYKPSRANSFRIELFDGKNKVGDVLAFIYKNKKDVGLQIQEANITPKYRGKGIMSTFYNGLNNYLKTEYDSFKDFSSDYIFLLEKGTNKYPGFEMWEGLVRRGKAERLGPKENYIPPKDSPKKWFLKTGYRLKEQAPVREEVVEEAAPVVEEAPKRNAKVFDYDNLSEQPLSVLEEKLEEAEIDTQEKDQRRRDIAKDKVRALKAEIKIAKEQLAKEKAPVKEAPIKKAPKKTTKKKAPVKEQAKISEEVQKEIDRAERLRDRIVAEKANKLSRTRGFEQKEDIRAEIRQAEKKYNNIITELKEGKRTQFQVKETQETKTDTSRYQQFVSVLKRSFPSVEVVTTQAEFDALLEETGAIELTTKDQSVYGAVYQGKLYLNPSLANYNTPIHEFGHVWMNVAKEANPELYEKGISLVKGSKYEQQVRNNPAYKDSTEQEILEEALATAIGDKGESFVKESQKKNFKQWLNTLYKFVRKLTGISKYTAKQLEDITLDEFTQAVAVDLLSGKQLFEGAEITDMGDALQLQIIGENAELSQQVREDLAFAKAEQEAIDLAEKEGGVEGFKISPDAIKEVTGWERGKDGKWRYEIQDGRLEKVENGTYKLGDIYDAPEFYKAYPDAKNIQVSIDVRKNGRENSWFFPETNSIEINVKNDYRVIQDLVHELQHYIQFKEGFAIGGNEQTFLENPEIVEDLMKKKNQLLIDNEILRAMSFVIEQVDVSDAIIDVGLDSLFTKDIGLLEEFVDEQHKENLVSLGLISEDTDFNEMIEDYYFGEAYSGPGEIIGDKTKIRPKTFKGGLTEMQRRKIKIAKRDGGFDEVLGELYEIHEPIQEDLSKLGNHALYERLAGEVEARNAATRLYLSAEKRRKKSLESTEDVAREDQILFMGDQAAAMASMAEKGVDLDAAMNEAINDMIDKGFKAAEIKGVLLQMGYKARAINDALIVNIDADMKLPNEFANIEGGVKEGEALFRSVMEKLKEFAAPKLVKRSMKEQYNEAKKDGYKGTLKEYTEEQNNKKVEMLKQANSSLVFFTNEEILKRYPNIQNEVVEKQQKSRAEIRAKAIKLLEAEAAFQAQDNLTKLELINSMDRTMKTRSNKQVQKRINAIKQTLKGVREGVKDLQAAKKRIKNFINEELLPIGLSVREASKLVRIVEKATKETYESSVAEVMKVVDAQTSKKKQETIDKMLKLAQQKSKGKKGAARTSPEAARFFKQAAVILKALSKNDTNKLELLEKQLRDKETKINEILDNINDGIEVDDKQQELVALAQAFDILGSLNKQDLSETQDAFNLMKSELESGMESLRTRRAARKAIYDRIREEANESIREGYGFLFDENGKPLSNAEIDSRRKEIWNEVTGIKSLVKAVGEWYDISVKLKMNFFADYLKHLGTLTNGLDRKGDFFKKNIYDKLNNMEESYLQGYFSTIDLLSSELEAIGIEGGYDGLSKIINDGLIRNENTRIEGIKLDLKGTPKKLSFSKAEAMRIYALSKNADQRARLKEQGFTDAKMQQIEEFLGEQLVQAADKVVDILSTSYYESVNKVYEDVNDVSLPFIENYFPTKKAASETTKSELEQLRSDISSGNFAGVFSAQQASALKERTSKDAIDIVGQDFSNVLEEHIRSMERFKAYAMGTKEINIVINHTGSVRALLKATNLKSTISDGIMYAINPNAMQQYFELKNRWFTGLQRRFVGVTLALKFIQLPKQASSFVNAFADYKLRQRNRIPGVDFVLDVLGFTFDTAYTLATFRSSYKEAMKSASFRNRIRESFKTADLLGLEVGVGTRSRMKKTKLGRALRKAKVVANSPTLVGDIMGVMGYMSAYRANLRNGMSEQEALEKFNSYNETQQTRRPTEKVGIQRSNSVFARSFTMFGSTFYLQLNKIMQSVTNIRRDGVDALKLAKNKEFKNAYKQAPKTKDYRELVLNLSIANFLFTAIANAFKYNPFMDDDDEITEEDMEVIKKAQNALKRGKEISDEEQELLERYQFQLDKNAVIRSYKESLFGLNQLYNMPIVGPSSKMLIDYYYWKDPNAFSSDRVRQVNPVAELTKDIGRDAVWNDQSIFESAVNPLISFSMGIDVNKPLALLDRVQYLLGDDEMYREGYEELNDKGERKFKGTFEEYKAKQMEENMYELMGISYSYRPGSGKDWTKKKITITIDPKTEKQKDVDSAEEKKKRAKALREKKRRRRRRNK